MSGTFPDQIFTIVAPDLSQGAGPFGVGSQVGRSSQGTALTGGARRTRTSSKKRSGDGPEGVTPTPRAKRPTLEKVPTHLEKRAESMSMEARVVYQEEILGRCGVQEETLTIDIGQLYPPVREKSVDLPIYQV